jgi:hypothetical protein
MARLASLTGVERVVVDDRASVAVLICQAGVPIEPMAEAAAAVIEDLGFRGLQVEVTARTPQPRGRRIRFVGARQQQQPDHTVRLTVVLEWDGLEIDRSVSSQPGEASELRGLATAALDAVTSIVGQDLGLRIGGVKRVRSFDTDLMVASLYRSGPPRQQLVGAVVAGDDPRRAACIAVLNALNRMLGNYLDR